MEKYGLFFSKNITSDINIARENIKNEDDI